MAGDTGTSVGTNKSRSDELSMPKTIAIAILMITTCLVGRADTVQLGKLRYPNVQVVDASDGKITFMANRQRIVKPAVQVSSVAVDGKGWLNRAEQLIWQGKAAEAVEQYDTAARMETGWLERLIRYRRLAAMDKASMVDRAVEEWLIIVDESQAVSETLELRPGNFAPKGSQQNATAIALLEIKAERVSNEAYVAAINDLLLTFYQHEGRKAKAASLAARITNSAESNAHSTAERFGSDREATRLEAMEILIDEGSAGQVLKDIKSNLHRGLYRGGLFPRALLLAGKAQKQLAEKANGLNRRKLLIAAGLDFMRVATFFPASDYAPEALLAAGKVNAALGNPWAAANAYKRVIKRYGDSRHAKIARDNMETGGKSKSKENAE